MKKIAVVAALSLFGATAAQAAGKPPDGTYGCVMLSGSMLMTLGTLEIDGDQYRGFSPIDWARYTVAADGGIQWTGSLSGMPEGFVLNDGQLTADSQGRPLIRVNYTSPRGRKQTVDCSLE